MVDGDDRPELVDVFDVLAAPDPGAAPRPRPPRPAWWVVAVIAAVAVGVVAVVAHGRAPADRGAAPSAARSVAGTSPSVPAVLPRTAQPVPSVTVTDVHRRILGSTGTWDLFARGDRVMVRIEPARGRVTATIVPKLATSGPVSFVALPDAVVVLPRADALGYGVADGEAATTLTGPGTGGPVFPGRRPGQLWVMSGGTMPSDPAPMTLLGADGMPTGSTVIIPAGATISADGAGYLMYTTQRGVTFDVRPSGRRQVSTGPVLAVGATRWLTAECQRDAAPAPNHRCVDVVTDSSTGTRRILGPRRITATPPLGVVSPDGRTAALPQPGTIQLVDLSSGTARPVRFQTGTAPGNLVWSPDGRWLFATTTRGSLKAIDPADASVHGLGVTLAPVSQLAVRP